MKILALLVSLFMLSLSARSQNLSGTWVEEGSSWRKFFIHITYSTDSVYQGQTITIFDWATKSDTLYAKLRGGYNKKDGYIYLEETEIIKGDKKYDGCFEILKLRYINNKKGISLRGISVADGPKCTGFQSAGNIILKKVEK